MRTRWTCKPCGSWLLIAAWLWLTGCAASTPIAPANGAISIKPLGQIRVVAWNLDGFESAASQDRWASFGRVLQRLQPDIVLVQGWPHANPAEAESAAIERVLHRVASIPNSRWRVVSVAEQGAAVLTRLPIVRRIETPIPLPSPHRFASVGAVLDTGRGTLLVSSFALSTAENPRLAAEAIAATVIAERDRVRPNAIVLGGWWGGSLGARAEQVAWQALWTGLDVDRSDLRLAGQTQRDQAASAPLLLGEAGLRLERVWLFEAAALQALAPAPHGPAGLESAGPWHPVRVADLTICPDGCD